jgi:hypothetical protein
MTDLAERLKAAAAAAIDDISPGLAEPRKLRVITVEIELANGGQVTGGRAWIERAIDLKRLLAGPPVPPSSEEL